MNGGRIREIKISERYMSLQEFCAMMMKRSDRTQSAAVIEFVNRAEQLRLNLETLLAK